MNFDQDGTGWTDDAGDQSGTSYVPGPDEHPSDGTGWTADAGDQSGTSYVPGPDEDASEGNSTVDLGVDRAVNRGSVQNELRRPTAYAESGSRRADLIEADLSKYDSDTENELDHPTDHAESDSQRADVEPDLVKYDLLGDDGADTSPAGTVSDDSFYDDFDVEAAADSVGDITINGPAPSANLPSTETTRAADPGIDHSDNVADWLSVVENGLNTTGAIVTRANALATSATATVKQTQAAIRPAAGQVSARPLPQNQQDGGWPFTPLQTVLGGVLAVGLVLVIKHARK